jgi:hypothetical protein
MKKYFLHFYCFAAIVFYTINLKAQWCIPESAIPYAASMPGITHVVLNTIDRTSSDLENYPDNSYVYAEETTTLVKGVNYEMTIDFTVDALICPDMNLRVWIDLDQNGSFDDIGETVLSADHISPNEFTDSFYLPDYTLTGNTRMRVTAKMSNLGGHTLPTPCDLPHDPFGYHGEFEDYDITITESTGINEVQVDQLNASVFPNPANGIITIEWKNLLPDEGMVTISGLNGEKIIELNSNGAEINQLLHYNASSLTPGIYIVSINSGGKSAHLKMIIN